MDEDKHIEWKEFWRDEHLKWICGFANAQDGVLEIGRNDKDETIGVKNISKLLKDLPTVHFLRTIHSFISLHSFWNTDHNSGLLYY